MKKLLLVGIIIIMVGMNISSSLSKSMTIENVITVDNEGDGDYTSIKEALNNANPGDTIEVYSGTYYERGIDVEKEGIIFQGIPFELGSGNDTGKPFIDGEGKDNIFLFDAKNITIDNFHIDNGYGPAVHDIIDLTEIANGCIISNNDLFHTLGAIIWIKSSNNKIINNNVSHSFGPGIAFGNPSSNCLISGNIIFEAEDGIKLWSSNQNTVMGNRVSNCSRFGIDVASNGNHIEGNSIEDTTNGIHMYGGINNRIIKNNLISNTVNVHNTFSIPGLIITIISNRFEGNYYDDWIGFGPKLLWGWVWLMPFPCFDIDWNPAQEPYDIGV